MPPPELPPPSNQVSRDLLHEAAERGDAAEVERGSGVVVDLASADGLTTLFIAAGRGHLAIAQALLRRGVVMNQATSDGLIPLLIAANEGHFELVELLLE